MKKLLIVLIVAASSCTHVLDKPATKENLEAAKHEVENADYPEMKKKYIKDNLTEDLGYMEGGKALVEALAKSIDVDVPKGELDNPTFRELIDKHSSNYDSIRAAVIEIKTNNENLDQFISLVDVDVSPISKYKGYLGMTLRFNNNFDKEVLYTVINYKYVDKYDSEHFNKNVKITDNVANNFKGFADISTVEEYNSVSDFMYSKVPVQAPKAMRDELGVDEANEKVKKDFLNAGFSIKCIGIVFADKSELVRQEIDWEYLD